SGDTTFAASVSVAQALTIARASTTTALKLSTITVTYGHENAETLTVHVRPQHSGAPAGKVIIKASRPNHQPLIVCTITLSSGTGKCLPQARTLQPGKYTLVASYGGNVDFNASASSKEALTVRK